MKFSQLDIPEVVLIEPTIFHDSRGWFMESFNEQVFQQGLQDLGQKAPSRFVQDNHSCSKKGVLRGLHYQLAPFAQGKLVRVIRGSVLDVVVDIREDSSSYLRHVAVELSSANQRMLWIPEGFAHGFIALEEDTHFCYKTTHFYNKALEGALRWNDPSLGIVWPLLGEIQVNEKDASAPLLRFKSRTRAGTRTRLRE